MFVIFGVGIIVAFVMFYRTAAKGKHKDTNPDAGSRPSQQGPAGQHMG